MAKGWRDFDGKFIGHEAVDNPLSRRKLWKSIRLDHEIEEGDRDKRVVNCAVDSQLLRVDVVCLGRICENGCNVNDLVNK